MALCIIGGGACSSPTTPPPSGPAPAVGANPLLGSWSGFTHIASCAPSGITYCRPLGYVYDFAMLVTEEGGAITARFETSTPETYVGTMTGVKGADGAVVFTPVTSSTGSVQMNSLRVTFDPISGLTGVFSYTIHGIKPVSTMAITSAIKSSSRSATPKLVGSAADFVGSWTGSGMYESCRSSSGAECGGRLPYERDYYLTIQSRAGGLEALLDSGIANWPPVRLHGSAQQDGSVVFSGSVTGVPNTAGGMRADVAKLQLWLDPNAGLTGSFEGVLEGNLATFTQQVRVLNGRRALASHSPGPLQGDWSGQFVVRECMGPSCQRAAIGRINNFHLKLSQTGSTLTGIFQDMPISGTTSGVTATLTGESIAASCGFSPDWTVCSRRVRNLTATVDSLGQMQGSFEYFEAGNHSGAYEFTARVDMINVMRRQ
jgi:hypothetical protein